MTEELKKQILYKETNEKFVKRVQNILYLICGLDKERAEIILKECLKQNK